MIIATPDDAIVSVAADGPGSRPLPSSICRAPWASRSSEPIPGEDPCILWCPCPTPAVGAERLRSGATFAVAGDPVTRRMAHALGGRAVEVDDEDRVVYHAAASIAANHLVALIGQVERLAASVGLPLEAFAGLLHAATDDALALGPSRALTGPAARGDWDTVERHRAALSGLAGHRTELAAYDAMVGLARRLSLDAAAGRAPGDTTRSVPVALDPTGVGQVA